MFSTLLQSAVSYFWLLPLTGIAYFGLSALLPGKKHAKFPLVGAWDALIPTFIHNIIFTLSAASLLKRGHEKVLYPTRSPGRPEAPQGLMFTGVVPRLDLSAHQQQRGHCHPAPCAAERAGWPAGYSSKSTTGIRTRLAWSLHGSEPTR